MLQNNDCTVKLIIPNQVKTFVVGNKNNHNNAVTIAKASNRLKVTLFPIKPYKQQVIQNSGRIRDRYANTRIADANQIWDLLADYDLVFKKKIVTLRK